MFSRQNPSHHQCNLRNIPMCKPPEIHSDFCIFVGDLAWKPTQKKSLETFSFFVSNWHWKKVMASQPTPPKVLLRNKAVWKTLLINPCFLRFGYLRGGDRCWDHEKKNIVVAKAMNLDRLGDFETQLQTLNLGFMRSTDGQGCGCWDGDVGVSSIWEHVFFWYYSNTNPENEGNVPLKGTISEGKSTSKQQGSNLVGWWWSS